MIFHCHVSFRGRISSGWLWGRINFKRERGKLRAINIGIWCPFLCDRPPLAILKICPLGFRVKGGRSCKLHASWTCWHAPPLPHSDFHQSLQSTSQKSSSQKAWRCIQRRETWWFWLAADMQYSFCHKTILVEQTRCTGWFGHRWCQRPRRYSGLNWVAVGDFGLDSLATLNVVNQVRSEKTVFIARPVTFFHVISNSWVELKINFSQKNPESSCRANTRYGFKHLSGVRRRAFGFWSLFPCAVLSTRVVPVRLGMPFKLKRQAHVRCMRSNWTRIFDSSKTVLIDSTTCSFSL